MINKKGFTLVELLAVIVILALLIVITANTILPMMSKTKKTAMVTFADRVLRNVETELMINSDYNEVKVYKISELMGQDNYYGCVFYDKTFFPVTYDLSDPVLIVVMFSKKDKYMLKAIGGKNYSFWDSLVGEMEGADYILFHGLINSNNKIEIKNLNYIDYKFIYAEGVDDSVIEWSSIEEFEENFCLPYDIPENQQTSPVIFYSK